MNKFIITNDHYEDSHVTEKFENEIKLHADYPLKVLRIKLKREEELLIRLMGGLYKKNERIFKNTSNVLIYYTNIPLSSKEWQVFMVYSKSNEKYKNLYMTIGNPKDESYRFIMRFEISYSVLILINSELSWMKYFYDTTFNRKFLINYFKWIEQDEKDAKRLIDLLYREVDEKNFPCFINTKILNLLDLRQVLFTNLFIKKNDDNLLPSIKMIINGL